MAGRSNWQPEHIQAFDMITRRYYSDKPPLCRDCQKCPDSWGWRGDYEGGRIFSIACHGEERTKHLTRQQITAAQTVGLSAFASLIISVLDGPWFFPQPPPGPEVP